MNYGPSLKSDAPVTYATLSSARCSPTSRLLLVHSASAYNAQVCGLTLAEASGRPCQRGVVWVRSLLESGGLRVLAPETTGLKPPIESVEVAVVDRKSTRLNSSHANISYA